MDKRNGNMTMGDRYEFITLLPKEILGKQSYVDYCLNSLGVTILDHDRDVVFLRVLRVGNEVLKTDLHPGHLVAVYAGDGKKVHDPSAPMGHYIVKMKHVIARINERWNV